MGKMLQVDSELRSAVVASASRQLEPPRRIGFERLVMVSLPISVAYVSILCENDRAAPFLESSVLNGGS